MARKALSKKIRFEVLKRDKFKCAYCGAEAPETILHIDHIKPVSKGGGNSLTNLTTSCQKCNSGKSNRELSDDSVVKKKRNQLEEMQARKELIEMMVEWELSLSDQYDLMVDGLERIFQQAIGDNTRVFAGEYRGELRKLCRKYGFKHMAEALRDSFESYLKVDADGETTRDSRSLALSKLGNIAKINEEEKTLPGVKKIGLIFSELKRSHYYTPNYWVVSRDVKDALRAGVKAETIQDLARGSSNWTQFQTTIQEFAEQGGNNHV